MDKLKKWLSDTIDGKKKFPTNKIQDNKFNKKNNYQKLNIKNNHKKNFSSKNKFKIMPLGGLNEVGKNCTILEYGDDIVVIDAGMQFPEEDMLGIDFVIPDFSYLEQNKKKIKALIITHGHLDHIGAIPHFLQKFPSVPIYATKLTRGIAMKRIEEFSLKANFQEINPEKDQLNFGNFNISFFRVNHSISDGVGLFIKTPNGNIVHTGDFKFDFCPADGVKTDFSRLAEIGKERIDVLFSDSTNAQKPGFCISEKKVGQALEEVIQNAKGRLIIASFSSLISRLQQIINFAAKNNRKVFISGRSMINNLEIASKLGFLKVPRGILKKLSPKIDELPPKEVLILTTGSQGESMSALSRISFGSHAKIKIQKGDTVIFSSSPIPGNERPITNIINNLFRLGAHVITNDAMDVHASGHAYQEDLKLMFSLMKPRHIAPIHGEFFMRMAHSDMLTKEFDLKENQVVILENGSILEIDKGFVKKSKKKLPVNLIMVDGLGMGDTASRVLRDRKIMSENGVIIVMFRAFEKSKRLLGNPDVISRGFIYMKESKKVAFETSISGKKAFEEAVKKNPHINLKDLKNEIYKTLRTFIRKKLNREPMIIPLVVFI